MLVLSSAVVGGGFSKARAILNMHVDKDYSHPDPASDLIAFAERHGIPRPFVGMMTAAWIDRAGIVTHRDSSLTVTAFTTARVRTLSAAGLSQPAPYTAGLSTPSCSSTAR
jgi:adenosylcobinamide amidohydrolase